MRGRGRGREERAREQRRERERATGETKVHKWVNRQLTIRLWTKTHALAHMSTHTHTHIHTYISHNGGHSFTGASVDQSKHVVFYNAVLITSRAAEEMRNALKHSKTPSTALHSDAQLHSDTCSYLSKKEKKGKKKKHHHANNETTAVLIGQDAEMEIVQAA